MAWTYSVESGESAKDLKSGSDLSHTVKETDTLGVCCCREWPLMISSEHQSGTTLHRLEGPCYQLSTSSMEDSHAKTSVLRDMVLAWKENEVVFSSRLSGLQKKLNLLSYFLKTSLQSGQEDLLVFVTSWPRWGMICDGQLSVPQALEPHTKGIGGSYLPTPTASEYGTQKSRGSDHARPSLNTMARQNKWPTPKASDWKNNGSPSEMRRDSPTLGALVGYQSGGKLSPMWVEWLMNYPSGWTELSAWVIPWFQNKSKKRSKS